jgi:alkylation response protein AidB-like acyl-CoA dehydrogenase
MDLTLSEEHGLLASSARAFVDRECPTSRVRELMATVDGFDPELWRTMSDLGWTAIGNPRDDHAGGGVLDLVVLCEALGRGPVPSPLVATSALAAALIAAVGSAAQRERWLPALASGAVIGTLAVVEPGAHDEWDKPAVAGGARIRGTKILVPWASVADVFVVATTDGLHLVEPALGGCTTTRHDDLDADPVFAVELDGAPAERLSHPDGEDHTLILRRCLRRGAVAHLAYAVGGAERALELTVRHACDREQFGRPIGSFQAVAHRCVDMRTDIDACRFLAYQAAWALDQDHDAALEVATALAYGKDALRRIFVNAHQVHGAIGFSTEHDLHLFTRRAKAFELDYGSAARHLEQVADEIGLG